LVYVVERGRMEAIRVELGITNNKVTEVLSGDLQERDAVVIEDKQKAAGSAPGAPRFRLF
jgi:hypothetical protein